MAEYPIQKQEIQELENGIKSDKGWTAFFGIVTALSAGFTVMSARYGSIRAAVLEGAIALALAVCGLYTYNESKIKKEKLSKLEQQALEAPKELEAGRQYDTIEDTVESKEDKVLKL